MGLIGPWDKWQSGWPDWPMGQVAERFLFPRRRRGKNAIPGAQKGGSLYGNRTFVARRKCVQMSPQVRALYSVSIILYSLLPFCTACSSFCKEMSPQVRAKCVRSACDVMASTHLRGARSAQKRTQKGAKAPKKCARAPKMSAKAPQKCIQYLHCV